MRFITTLLPVSCVVAAGFGAGCSYPFAIDVESSLTMPLGAAVHCAEAIEGITAGTLPADGVPDEQGNLTVFEHTFYTGNRCTLHAEWSGPLVDMDGLRAEAESEMREIGVDPERVDVHISEMEPRVTAVGLEGSDGGGAPVQGLSYRATLGVPRSPNIFVMEAGAGDDIAEPNVTFTPSRRMLRDANEAWRERTPMEAVGKVDVDIDLDEAGAAPAGLPESIRVDFVVTLEGDAGARTTFRPEDFE